MTDTSGNLSVDFLVGFTIFMVAFIWVATLVPNLFLGVSAHGIDFDAVAYRTGVILAEDPGASNVDTPWEVQLDSGKANIARFGLAVSKETPNLLSDLKVKRFFDLSTVDPNVGFIYPDDYREKVIFGDYPYRFNISLHEVGKSNPQYVGDVRPENYGFIRREVKIKGVSNATIGKSDFTKFKEYNTDKSPGIINGFDGNVTSHDFTITINRSVLLHDAITNPVINPNYYDAYRIDPRSDWINITIGDFFESPAKPTWLTTCELDPVKCSNVKISLLGVRLTQNGADEDPLEDMPPEIFKDYLFKNGDLSTPVYPPFDLIDGDTLTLRFKPGTFAGNYDRGAIYINMTFGTTATIDGNPGVGFQYLNTSSSGPWSYNYNATEVTQPKLKDAVMEVAVW